MLVFWVNLPPLLLAWFARLMNDVHDSEQRWQITRDADIFR